MTLQEYINELLAIGNAHGFGLEVETYNAFSGRQKAPEPKISYRMVLKGREMKSWPRFYASHDDEERRGEKVVEV
jgi:hypothetical protein